MRERRSGGITRSWRPRSHARRSAPRCTRAASSDPEYEAAIVEAFTERIEQAIDARVDERLAQAGDAEAGAHVVGARRGLDRSSRSARWAAGSAATGAATGMGSGGVVVAIIVWIAIAAINVANLSNR